MSYQNAVISTNSISGIPLVARGEALVSSPIYPSLTGLSSISASSSSVSVTDAAPLIGSSGAGGDIELGTIPVSSERLAQMWGLSSRAELAEEWNNWRWSNNHAANWCFL